MQSPSEPLSLFAVAPPGLEALVAAELAELGVRAAVEPGGAAWQGGPEQLYQANLRLRTATRVLVRAAEFRARTFFELERHARRVTWERFVPAGVPVRLRVSSSKSRLYHQRAIEERLWTALGEAVGAAPAGSAAGEEDEEGADEQLLVVRFHRDRCTISADSSGAALHRRGYRQALGRAPLRETLGAALLMASGWDARSPLLDPFCGSGTIPVEAALLARRVAPGLASPGRAPRAFAFQRWAEHDPALWERVVERARAEIRDGAGVAIVGSDRDAGAVEAAAANAARAGVLDDLRLEKRALSAVEPPPGPGWLVTNPPYGVRVGDRRALRDLYAALGSAVRARLPGWTVALLGADATLEAQLGLPMREALRTRNGGIPVRVLVSEPDRG